MHAFKTKLATQCSVRMRLCRKYTYLLEISAKEEKLVLFANFGTICHLNMHRAMQLSNKNTDVSIFLCITRCMLSKKLEGKKKGCLYFS